MKMNVALRNLKFDLLKQLIVFCFALFSVAVHADCPEFVDNTGAQKLGVFSNKTLYYQYVTDIYASNPAPEGSKLLLIRSANEPLGQFQHCHTGGADISAVSGTIIQVLYGHSVGFPNVNAQSNTIEFSYVNSCVGCGDKIKDTWKWAGNHFIKESSKKQNDPLEDIIQLIAEGKLEQAKKLIGTNGTVTEDGYFDKRYAISKLYFNGVYKQSLSAYKSKNRAKAASLIDSLLFTDPILYCNSGCDEDDGKNYLICINGEETCSSKYHVYPVTKPYTLKLNDAAFFLQKNGDFKKAVVILKQIVKYNPQRTSARLNLADALWDYKKLIVNDSSLPSNTIANIDLQIIDNYSAYETQMKNKKRAAKIPKRVTQRLNELKKTTSLDSSSLHHSVKNYYGNWKVESVERYRGGITTETEAKSKVGGLVIIEKDRFIFLDDQVNKPRYKYTRFPTTVEEGVIPERKTTYFFGYESKREEINYYAVNQDGSLYMSFEALADGSLIVPDDGWIYRLKRSE